MDWSAHNAGYVIASYAISGVLLALAVAWVLLRDRRGADHVKRLKD